MTTDIREGVMFMMVMLILISALALAFQQLGH